MTIYITNGKRGIDKRSETFSIRSDANRETIIKRVNKIKKDKGITDPIKVISNKTLNNIKRGFFYIEEYYREEGYMDTAA